MSKPNNKPTYDSVWKALPDEVLLALVRLVVPNIGPTLTPWKTDIKVMLDRDLDNAYLVTINGITAILLLEYQNYLDATMPRRIFQYVVLLKLQYFQRFQKDIPVLPIVIWAVAGTIPEAVYENNIIDDIGITCRYRQIQLSMVDWHTVDPMLLVLAPYLQGVELANLEEIAVTMYETAPPEYRLLLLGALLNISRRTYKNIDEIEQAILQRVRIKLDEIYEAIAEGPIGVRLKAEGEAKGEVKGKSEGLRKAVVILWEHRFGAILKEVDAALANASDEDLQKVVERFAENPTEADIRAQLGL